LQLAVIQFQLDAVDARRSMRATTARIAGGGLLVQVVHGKRLLQVVVMPGKQRDGVVLMCSCGAPNLCAHAEFAVEAVQDHRQAKAWMEKNFVAAGASAQAEAGGAARAPIPPPAQIVRIVHSPAPATPPAPPRAPSPPPEEREALALERWVHGLVPTRVEPRDADKPRVVLFYCAPSGRGHRLEVAVYLGQPKKRVPGFSRTRPLDLTKALRNNLRLSHADLGLIAALRAQSSDGFTDHTATLGDDGHELLLALLATGRLYADGDDPALLARGEPRQGTLLWKTASDGAQRPDLTVAGGGDGLLFEQPLYFDVTTATIGVLELAQPIDVVRGFLAGSAVRAETSSKLTDAAHAMLEKLKLPAPRRLRIESAAAPPPVPRLRLYTRQVRQGYFYEALTVDGAHLSFVYGTHEFAFDDEATLFRRFDGDRVLAMRRDRSSEAKALAQLHALGFRPLSASLPQQDWPALRHALGTGAASDLTLNARIRRPEPEVWQQFVQGARRELVQQGWRIEIDPAFRHAALPATAWFVRAQPATGAGDWFDLDVGIEVGDERVDLMPILLQMLQQGDKVQELTQQRLGKDEQLAIALPDGRRVTVSAQRLQTMLRALLELQAGGKVEGDKLRLRRLLAPQVLALEEGGTQVEWRDDGALRALAHKLRDFEAIAKVDPPATVRAELRSYQRDGLAWLQFLRAHELGGILADDMGLGKTLQALAHIALEKAEGRLDRPCLVVSPTSVVANWAAEAARFTPELRVLVLHGAGRAASFAKLAEYDLVLTTYPLVPRDIDALRAQPFHLLIADEAQAIKNARAKVAQALRELDARHRLCLTGTPLENNLAELWAQFDFLMPGVLGDARTFGQVFRGPIEKGGDGARQKALGARIRPFLLRRSKATVARELPPKTEVMHGVELESAQRDLYETIRLSVHERVRQTIAEKGIEQAQIIILDALLKLRQVCCDPRLVKLEAAKGVQDSAKLDALFELLTPLVAEGRRVLLFSQFTSMLALIEAEMHKRALAYVKLTGDTKDRKTPVARFQKGEVPVFLISLKAGGTGLNLTAADTVIHYDPWWNPAAEQQATDRAHRIGQDKPVFVYKLIATGTVEERIGRLQERKRALAAGVLDGSDRQGTALTKGDVEALFAAMA
jgi:superfamily II DNA or RNA helicase